jgi:hypothetical protein
MFAAFLLLALDRAYSRWVFGRHGASTLEHAAIRHNECPGLNTAEQLTGSRDHELAFGCDIAMNRAGDRDIPGGNRGMKLSVLADYHFSGAFNVTAYAAFHTDVRFTDQLSFENRVFSNDRFDRAVWPLA